MRINDLAKKYGVSADELIGLLQNAGYDIDNQTSSIDYDMLTALDRHFSWSETPTGTSGKARAKSKTRTKAKAKSKTGTKTRAKASATTKTKTKTKTKTETKAKAKVKVKAKAKAKGKGKARARSVAAEAAELLEETESETTATVKAKTRLVRKRKPEPEVLETVEAAPEKDGAPEVAPEAPPITILEPLQKPEPAAPTPDPFEKRAKPVKAEKPEPAAVRPIVPREPRRPAAVPPKKVEKRPGAIIISRPEVPPPAKEKPKDRKKKKKKTKEEQDAQQRAVRESVRRTLAKIDTAPARKTKRRKTRPTAEEAAELPPVQVQDRSTVQMVAALLGAPLDEVLGHLEDLDLDVAASTELDRDTIQLLGEEFGRIVEIEAVYGETRLREEAQVDPAKLVGRSPVVTVMGHVDHGKTSILDFIRKANVAAGEAGGITQHIGAHEVETSGGKITFIDTPGHEAFTAMRARGAGITDIVVLVVAADDGVMPQTIEAINHTRAAGVPMVVAVNKCDLVGANPGQVKQQLMQYEVMIEEFGGEVVSVDVSAKTGDGIDKLLEMISLQAEILELEADPTARPQGVVVESRKEEGRGMLVTVLMQQGTLKKGAVLVIGNEWAKVRSLIDDRGKPVKEAGPAIPVQILGANGLPEPGDPFVGVKNEREAREISEKRQEAARARELQPHSKILSLEDLYAQIQQGQVKELNVIIKGDTNGSVEALRESLAPMEVEDIKVKIIHAAVGVVSDTDVMLAEGSQAVIIAFGTKVSPQAKQRARQRGIDIRAYNIIYEVIEDVEKAMTGMLEPVFVERVLGRAEVRQLFKVSRLGTIAGSYVLEGNIPRNASVRVLRNDEVLHDGRLSSLKRFQDDVREVAESFECGIGIQGFDALNEGDIIEAYAIEEKTRVV